MGIFVQNDQEDIELVRSLLKAFERVWNEQPTLAGSKLLLSVNDGNFDVLVKYANQAFTEFESPSHYQRMSAFLVLTTVCPCVSLKIHGVPLTNSKQRRWVFARVNLLFLPLLFEMLERPHNPRWHGWPPETIVQQIVGFLERIDVSDVVKNKDFAHSISGLAKDIAALSIIIQLWSEYGREGRTATIDDLLAITGLLGGTRE